MLDFPEGNLEGSDSKLVGGFLSWALASVLKSDFLWREKSIRNVINIFGVRF
jgi:hypothetical protein